MKKLASMMPHIAIIICNMFFVFFAIDQVNTAMAFVNHSITKTLLAIMCALSILSALVLMAGLKRDARRAAARRRKRAKAERSVKAHA